jgi:hypothetical protein
MACVICLWWKYDEIAWSKKCQEHDCSVKIIVTGMYASEMVLNKSENI